MQRKLDSGVDNMFGLKKRKYRHEVAQMIASMALPENLELATAKIAPLLEGEDRSVF
jgi:hypothetical protein